MYLKIQKFKMGNLCSGLVAANVHRFFVSDKVLSWIPASWAMGFYEILPSCPSLPVKGRCWQPSWKYLKPQACWSLKKEKANKPTFNVYRHTHAYTHTPMGICIYGMDGCIHVYLSIGMEGGRGRERDINISWSLWRQGFPFLEGSHWQCQPSKKKP